MEDLLKWVESQASGCRERMDAHEAIIDAIVDEERAKIARGEGCDAHRLAGHVQALQRGGDQYEVWMTVLHEVTRHATLAGVDAAKCPC